MRDASRAVMDRASSSVVYDRALGAYLGLALGDALGATVEFMTPREIALRFEKQGGVHRHIIGGGWLKLARGQVTDDTTMSLALGDALLRGGEPALRRHAEGDDALVRDMGDAFVRWWRGKPVDCGNTCRRGILRYMTEGTLAAPPNEGDAGNGAVMRNLPVVLATLHDDEAFERLSIAQARLTHHHPLSDAATLGLGQLTRLLLRGGVGQTAAVGADLGSAVVATASAAGAVVARGWLAAATASITGQRYMGWRSSRLAWPCQWAPCSVGHGCGLSTAVAGRSANSSSGSSRSATPKSASRLRPSSAARLAPSQGTGTSRQPHSAAA